MNRSDTRHDTGPATDGGGVAGWRQQLGELALACAGSFPEEEGLRLRELRRLLAAAPAVALVRGLTVPSAAGLDEWIAVNAASSAALAMLGHECGYLLSRGAGGQHLASLILPGATEETSASGDTMALALVGALGLALAEVGLAQPGATERPVTNRPSRLN